jgi:hypothetical protein
MMQNNNVNAKTLNFSDIKAGKEKLGFDKYNTVHIVHLY